MKILRLRAKGFVGLQKGLGLSEIDIDLSQLSKLIAITGENGAGKSSFLELLTPYPCLFSRSPTFKNHCYLRDSHRIIDIEYEGSHYECMVKIDCQSGKSEGFVIRDGKSLTDGKISTYSQKIEEIFGSRTLFENSIFCSQNSETISDLTTGQLKSLFSEFLRLEKLVGYETTSKQCVVVLESLKRNVEKEIDVLENKAEGRANVERELSEEVKREEGLDKEVEQLTDKISTTEEDYEAIKETLSKSLVKKDRLKNFEQNLTRFKNDRDRESESAEGELNRLRIKLRGVNDELSKSELLLKDKAEIMNACQQESEIAERVPVIEKDIECRKKELDKADSEINEITKTINENRRAIDAGKKDPEVARLEAEIGGKREKTVDLEKRDPACQSEICSFIVGALEAQKELPALEQTLSTQQKVVAEQICKTTEAYDADMVKVAMLKKAKAEDAKDYNAMVVEKYALNEKLKKIRLLSVKKPDIAVAMSQKEGLEKRKDEITSEGIRIRDTRNKSTAMIDNEIKKLNTEIENLKGSIDNALDEKKDGIKLQINESKLVLEDTNKKISDTKESIAVLKQSRAEKIASEIELVTKKDKLDKLVHEQSEWTYLRAACSKDGIQALEIDAVAPLISSYANDLLSRSFANNFMVRLRTQTDEGKETLDIVVVLENGDEVLLENMSGGQKVYILEALRLSLALINVEKSGRRYQTFLADENDGALSVENAKNFIELYKSAMEIGGMDAVYFISHKSETIALADHVIMFEDGQITIN